ncbi:MAG: polysaccharide biosynthesis/export family protein [Gammaproteobacteria bacterium]
MQIRALRQALVVLTLGLLFSAALSAQQTSAGAVVAPADYIIGPEDVLEISVWREPDLQREVLVRPDGRISFPLAGDVKAADKTPEQVQEVIAQRIERYIPDPVVTVTVRTIGGNKIYVIGQVKNPGAYVIGRYVDVLQALTLAGGLSEFARENNIRILRREGGRETVFPFEYGNVKKGRKLQQNIILKGGDTVVVP